jgi:hypothetical protein
LRENGTIAWFRWLPELVGAEAKVAVENHFYNRATRQDGLRSFVVQDGRESYAGSGPGPDADAAERVTRCGAGDSSNTRANAAASGDGSSVPGPIALTGDFAFVGIDLAARAGIGGNQA